MLGDALAVMVAVLVAVMELLADIVMLPPAALGAAACALCAACAVWICVGVCAVNVRLASGALGADGVLLLATLITVVAPCPAA